MILVIDTSSARSVMATIDRGLSEELIFDVRETPLPTQFPHVVKDVSTLERIAVAIGPGSFTGVRVGVSFGLGLAMGLRIPIVPLPTLGLQAARAADPVLAVAEAGRGRVYHLTPGGAVSLGEPADLPTNHDVVGWLREETRRSMLAAGLRFRPESELKSFAEAAARLLQTAREVPYGRLKIEYMQSFSPARS